MNQNRSGPKLSLDKGVEGVLMDRAMEYLDVLLDGADSVSRTSRISEKDVIQAMQMCVDLRLTATMLTLL